MSTILLRNIKTIKLKTLAIERDLTDLSRQYNNISRSVNSSSKRVDTNVDLPTIPSPPSRQVILRRFSEIQEPEIFEEIRTSTTEELQRIINIINRADGPLSQVERAILQINVYIDIGKKILETLKKLINAFVALLRGLKLALVPLSGLAAVGKIIQKISEIIGKVKAWVEKNKEIIKTFEKWVDRLIKNTLGRFTSLISDLRVLQRSIILKIQDLINFVNSLTLDFLKSLLGISPLSRIQIIEKYAEIDEQLTSEETDNDNDDGDDDDDATNGDIDGITKTIFRNPNIRDTIDLSDILRTRLNFIINSQRQRDIQEANDYLRSLTEEGFSLEQISEILNRLNTLTREEIANLNRPNQELIDLIEQNINRFTKPTFVEKPLKGEFERTNLNIKNAVISYERKTS
jgi:DNA-binding transcriptional MerR regulator